MVEKPELTIDEYKVPLSKVLNKLRSDLEALQNEASKEKLHFIVEAAEVELQVAITAEAGGEVGVDWWVYTAKGQASIAREATQTITLKLLPVEMDASGKRQKILVSNPVDDRK